MGNPFLKYLAITSFFLNILSEASHTQNKSSEQKISKVTMDVTIAMNAAAMEWNKGNLNGFMKLYDAAATMMMNDKRIGVDSIRGLYVKYYFDINMPKQQLTYENYQLTMLGKNFALLTGVFILTAADNLPEKRGRFSVIMVHRSHHWLLLHDHSG